MKPRRWLLRLLQVVLLIAIAIGVHDALAEQLAQITWADVVAAGTPNAATLALSTLLLLGVYLAHALLWRRITREIDGGTTSLRAALHAYFVSGLGRYVPGRLWQLAGLAVLAGRAGLAPSRAVAASVLGQLGFLTTGLVFLGLTLPNIVETMSDARRPAINPVLLASGLVIAVAVLLWLLVATRLGRTLHAWADARLGQRMGERVRATLAIADQVEPRRALLWALGYAASWLLFGAAFLLFVRAFVPVPADHALQVAGTVAAAYLAGYLFILTPAGLGMREAAMFVLLGPIVGTAAAAVIPVLSRLWFTVAELLPLALIPLLPKRTQ